MEKQLFLDKLRQNVPLFTFLPNTSNCRITGSESEFAVHQRFSRRADSGKLRIAHFTFNGGKFYIDCGHLEGCTPETTNAIAWLAYYEAIKLAAVRKKYSKKIFARNADWNGQSHGHHENYATTSKHSAWTRLLPYLVARTVFAGAGYWNNGFTLSQRAGHITQAIGNTSTSDRPILHLKLNEPLVGVGHKEYSRFHLISGDDTMCQFGSLLKVGMTSLMLEMLELGEVPNISFTTPQDAVKDFKTVSASTSNWHLAGIVNGPKGAIELLALYLKRATELFLGRDDHTDAVLYGMELAIEWLARDPMTLVGYLDWPTKLWLLDEFSRKERDSSEEWLRSQDSEYHNLNPEEGTYHFLLEKGTARHIVSPGLIEKCITTPPEDARASARGQVVSLLAGRNSQLGVCPSNWCSLDVVPKEGAKGPIVYMFKPISFALPTPWDTYPKVVQVARETLKF